MSTRRSTSRRAGRRAGRRGRALALVLGLVGCDTRPPPAPPIEAYEDEELAAQVLEEPAGEAPRDPPPPISDSVEPTRTHDVRDRRPPTVVPATHGDDEYANDTPLVARRYVYRVSLLVPAGLGSGRDHISVPYAELFMDVSHERLRARFVGRGWPVPAGSEIRLRRDRPGVYLFDREGGRPLEPMELASWFEGGHVSRRGPPLRILGGQYGGYSRERLPTPEDDEVPGELVCALLAEWAGESWDGAMRRCERGAPYLWRLGFWRAEQTAGVPVDLTRSALRADERRPPAPVPDETSGAFLEPEALSRLRGGHAEPPAEDAPAEGLRVLNRSATRAIVTVQGIAVGWVDAGAEALFVGLRPGVYDVGAMRPLGAVVQRGRPVTVPGAHMICDGRCARRPAPEQPPRAP